MVLTKKYMLSNMHYKMNILIELSLIILSVLLYKQIMLI